MIIMWPEIDGTFANLTSSVALAMSNKSNMDFHSYQKQLTVRKAI